jgi:Ras-related GTP-binding protein A/B
MFFITRLTENTNLAVSIPPFEHIFNAARINIGMARSKVDELDVSGKRRADNDDLDDIGDYDDNDD